MKIRYSRPEDAIQDEICRDEALLKAIKDFSARYPGADEYRLQMDHAADRIEQGIRNAQAALRHWRNTAPFDPFND